jgi:hypothetical protein
MAEKTFTLMKANVGYMCENDTSSAFATLAGRWLNDRYKDVWNRYNWSDTINNGYTLTLVNGTANYNLPADFEQEIAVVDITDGIQIKRYNERYWWRERGESYSGGSITNGTSWAYKILREKLKSDGSGFGVLQFDPTPANTHTIAMPYKRICGELISISGECTTNTTNKVIASASTFITSGVTKGMRLKNTTDRTYSIVSSVDSETQLTMDTDVCPDGNETFEINTTPAIRNICYILECGAISDGLLYKKQYAKASDFLQKYEYELAKRIGEENKAPNQMHQWIPERDSGYFPTPFTGWQSYDTV